MLDTLTEHLFDLLHADPRLLEGGSAYAAGWPGVVRIDAEEGEAATAGHINLFESSYDADTEQARPAIYRGMKGIEASDKGDMPVACGPGQFLQYRAAVIPLVLVASVEGTKRQASRQCNQLLNNVERILISHLIEDGFWYELCFAEELGGRRTWSSAPNGGFAEAMAVLPIKLRYSWSVNAPA